MKQCICIFTVRAMDLDSVESSNGRIVYSLQSDSSTPLPFTVETKRVGGSYDGIIKVSG